MDIVYLDRLSFQPTDEQGVPNGDPEIVTRGNPVPDYVPPFIRNALLNSGAIVQVADDPAARQTPSRFAPPVESPRALPNPEQPPTPDGLPPLFSYDVEGSRLPSTESSDAVSADTTDSHVTDFTPLGDTGGGQRENAPAAQKPAVRDSKQAWEDYAVATGMDRADAESKTKAELIAEVEGRENA